MNKLSKRKVNFDVIEVLDPEDEQDRKKLQEEGVPISSAPNPVRRNLDY